MKAASLTTKPNARQSKATRLETKAVRVKPRIPAAPSARATKKPPMGIRKIVVPVDFSVEGRPAIEYATTLADAVGAGLLFVHVMEPVFYAGEFAYVPVDTTPMRERVETEFTDLRRRIPSKLQTNTLIKDGLPFQEIIATAQESGADLIVMSTHGYTGLKHVFLGSTAERVVRHATCPVLVVRSRKADQASR